MDEGHESQRDIVPYPTGKGKNSLSKRLQKILRRPAGQAITRNPIEQTPDEMSVERAREILEFIVNIPERGLDAHERDLTPHEQLVRFGGIHYEDIKKAFGVYADHLVTTHGAKNLVTIPNPATIHEDHGYRLLKENLPGPPQEISGKIHKYNYDLALAIKLDSERSKTPKAVRLRLHDGKNPPPVYPHNWGTVRVETEIPLVNVVLYTHSMDEYSSFYYDYLNSTSPNRASKERTIEVADWKGMGIAVNNPRHPAELFHLYYKSLWRGMRWAAANLLCWDENRIVFPDDLDKPPFNKEQAQLNRPKLELPPKP